LLGPGDAWRTAFPPSTGAWIAARDVYEALRRGEEPHIHPDLLRARGNWPENEELCDLRSRHKQLHGELGQRAHFFTEGGYCTLYAAGMGRRGRGGFDDAIAEACARVCEDEFDHMLHGIAGLDREPLAAEDRELLTRLTVEQARLRIRMRNAQFSHPLSESRVAELCEGKAEPHPFDWERAGLEPPPA
jgi:hypothetical protein